MKWQFWLTHPRLYLKSKWWDLACKLDNHPKLMVQTNPHMPEPRFFCLNCWTFVIRDFGGQWRKIQ